MEWAQGTAAHCEIWRTPLLPPPARRVPTAPLPGTGSQPPRGARWVFPSRGGGGRGAAVASRGAACAFHVLDVSTQTGSLCFSHRRRARPKNRLRDPCAGDLTKSLQTGTEPPDCESAASSGSWYRGGCGARAVGFVLLPVRVGQWENWGGRCPSVLQRLCRAWQADLQGWPCGFSKDEQLLRAVQCFLPCFHFCSRLQIALKDFDFSILNPVFHADLVYRICPSFWVTKQR